MDTDIIAEDEFHAGQSDPVIGDEGKGKGLIRVSHVHHDFGLGPREVFYINPFNREIQEAFVNISRLAFCTANGSGIAGSQYLTSFARPHNTGNAQFPADDSSMTGPSPPVGDDGRGHRHDWFPIGIRHLRHQYLLLPKFMDVLHVGEHINRSRPDFFADTPTFD